MKRKKGAALPRLTVLAMSRKELTSFVLAVESLRSQVNSLAIELVRLVGQVDRLTHVSAARGAKRSVDRSKLETNGEDTANA